MTTTQKLSLGMHHMHIFGDGFDDDSFCWMMEDGELYRGHPLNMDIHHPKGGSKTMVRMSMLWNGDN